jgi:hypothetical protein
VARPNILMRNSTASRAGHETKTLRLVLAKLQASQLAPARYKHSCALHGRCAIPSTAQFQRVVSAQIVIRSTGRADSLNGWEQGIGFGRVEISARWIDLLETYPDLIAYFYSTASRACELLEGNQERLTCRAERRAA